MIGHHPVYTFVFHRLLGTEDLWMPLQGHSRRGNRPWGACHRWDWDGLGWIFPSIFGAEIWCLDFQILLMVSTTVLVGKPAMVQLIRSASRSVWNFEFGAMFCSNNSGPGILKLCKTILCETVGILARRGRQSSSEELSRPEIVEFAQRATGSFLWS